nr:BLUF domain-containing protein [Oceanococcus sp. HetDA_MAG_MS8]
MTKPDHSLVQLCYVSVPSNSLTLADVDDILHSARHNNLRHGITGVLSFGNGYFLQILEGAHSAVESTYETICLDPRHSHVKRVQLIGISQRNFDGWAMSYIPKPMLFRMLTAAGVDVVWPDGAEELEDIAATHYPTLVQVLAGEPSRAAV